MKFSMCFTLFAFVSGVYSKSLLRRKRQQDNTDQCICLPYYQCKAGNIIDDTGSFIIEQRIDLGDSNPCEGQTEICCTFADANETSTLGVPPSVTDNPFQAMITTEKETRFPINIPSEKSSTDFPEENGELATASNIPEISHETVTPFIPVGHESSTEPVITHLVPEGPRPDEPNVHYGEPTDESEGSTIGLPQKPSGVFGCGVRRENPIESRFGLSTRITGTDELPAESTFFGETPWMVAIFKETKNKKHFVCGGSLIATHVVLTAAHCVQKLEVNNILVRAGDWDSLAESEPLPHQDRLIQNIVMHKDFNSGSLQNDIALLFVDRPFDLSDNVDIICIDKVDFLPENCFASGWGAGSFGERIMVDKSRGLYEPFLKKVELPLVDRDTCQEQLRQTRLGRFFKLHKSFICAGGEKNRDTCSGDGGGPLVCNGGHSSPHKYSQVGIISWGIGCGNDHPAVYSSVDYFYDWITSQITS